ncbi:MAG: EcsC family protein [Taibaiella sp.]|jgi:hypothetical protein
MSTDHHYEDIAFKEMRSWQEQMLRRPGFFNKISKKLQTRFNAFIPEKVHSALTTAIKQMIKGVLYGAKHITASPLQDIPLQEREEKVDKRIEAYRTTAAVEGGLTGAGGLLIGLADFPLLIAIKIKLLFDLAALYGFDVKNYKERVYLLHIFELAFSSDEHRKNSFIKMQNWKEKSQSMPDDIEQFDWRNFQQEYRDYIDLAKMAQLIPVIGAPVGAIVNYRLIRKLGVTAKNAYRMRLLEEKHK